MAQAGITLSKITIGAYSLLTSWSLSVAGSIWRALARRPRRQTINRREIRSIGIFRLDEMGDFTLFSSLLRPLRQAFPDAHITLVLCDWICPLAELCPYVDELVPFPSSGPRWWQFLLGPFRALGVAMKLGRRFDLVINPRFDRDIRGAGFLANFSLAPWVLGYPSSTESFKAAVNRGYDRFYTHLLPVPDEVLHEVDRSRQILEYLAIPDDGSRPELWISHADRRRAHALLRQDGWRPGDTLICLGVAASYARKRWPMDNFVQLAQRLCGSLPRVKFLIVGGVRDRETAELLRTALASRLINLAGRAALRVSAAALEECLLYIGNDSGPKHLAAALGKPVAEISCHPIDGNPAHFQSPERFAAVADSGFVLAPAKALPPCHASCRAAEPHCITQVTVGQVLEAVVTLVESCQTIHRP